MAKRNFTKTYSSPAELVELRYACKTSLALCGFSGDRPSGSRLSGWLGI